MEKVKGRLEVVGRYIGLDVVVVLDHTKTPKLGTSFMVQFRIVRVNSAALIIII
jgi:hypothetical protein